MAIQTTDFFALQSDERLESQALILNLISGLSKADLVQVLTFTQGVTVGAQVRDSQQTVNT